MSILFLIILLLVIRIATGDLLVFSWQGTFNKIIAIALIVLVILLLFFNVGGLHYSTTLHY